MPTECRSMSSCRADESLAGAGPGEGRRRASRRPWAGCGCGIEDHADTARKAGPPDVRHRPVDPADRRRRRGQGRRHPGPQRGAVRVLSAASGSIIRPSAPFPTAARRLPLRRPPLVREHRLYQADWLMRFYGFGQGEIIAPGEDLDLEVDPKTGLGPAPPGRLSGGPSTPPTARPCCGRPAWAREASTASLAGPDPDAADPGGRQARLRLGQTGQALHRHRRLDPGAADRRRGPARAASPRLQQLSLF